MSERHLHIGEVAHLLNTTPKAIRHYHELGLIDEPARSEAGYRQYGVAELHRLQFIQRLQSLGLSLRQIHFILHTQQPEQFLRDILTQRQHALSQQITELQHQQARIQAFLSTDPLPLAPTETPAQSSMQAIRTVIPSTSYLGDLVLHCEQSVLEQLDRYRWSEGYEAFWHTMAGKMLASLSSHEHLVILWMERYLALETMTNDDPQAHAWLDELRHSPVTNIIRQSWRIPSEGLLAQGLLAQEQGMLERLMPLLFLGHGEPLQQQFAHILLMS